MTSDRGADAQVVVADTGRPPVAGHRARTSGRGGVAADGGGGRVARVMVDRRAVERATRVNTVKVAVLLRVDDEEPHEVGSVLLTGPEQITAATVELLRTVADEVEARE